MIRKIFVLFACTAAVTLAQTPAAQYQQAADILKGNVGTPAQPRLPVKSRAKNKQPDIVTWIVGEPVQVHREVALSPNARAALELSEKFQSSGAAPISGPGGRLFYEYGQGVPTVVCSTLQVCEVDLEPGESLTKDALDWGDTVRFKVIARTAGNGPDEFTYLVMKPDEPGLDTTLVVGTNRRAYYLRLVSSDRGHMTQVAFRYPEEEDAQRKAAEAAEEAKTAEAERAAAAAATLAKLNTDKPLRNWNYKVTLHGKDAAWLRPVKIADDGIHTHISLSAEARHRGLPVVEIRDARGPVPANDRWDGNELIIDAVFEHACLLEGVGRAQQRACITNEGLNSNVTH